jgi:single-stranded-DNA-specific exonuclease
VLHYDGELSIEQITPALYDQVQRLEPFGMGNPEPVFVARALRVALPPRVLKDKHIKLRLMQSNGTKFARAIEALGWGLADRVQQIGILAGDIVDVAFTLECNTHPEYGGLEMRIEDVVKAAGVAAT